MRYALGETTYSKLSPMSYINPILGKTIALAGRFSRTDHYHLSSDLEQAGAKLSNTVDTKIDLLIYGRLAGKKLEKAQELGIEQWSEERVMAELELFKQHYIDGTSTSQNKWDVMRSPVRYLRGDSSIGINIDTILDLPLVLFDGKQTLTSEKAYLLDHFDYYAKWQHTDLETITALALFGLEGKRMAEFMTHAERFTGLRSLVIHNWSETIDVNQLLSVLPNLESLHLMADADFGAIRHSNLQHLTLLAEHANNLDIASLPNLRFFNPGYSNNGFLIDAMTKQSFPKLAFIDLCHSYQDDLTDFLPKLQTTPSLRGLSFNQDELNLHDHPENASKITDWSGAKQLTHIEIHVGAPTHLAMFNRKHFPCLTHLWIKARVYSTWITAVADLDLWDGLHLNFSESPVSSSEAEALYNTLVNKPALASLDLRYTKIKAKRVINKLKKLPYPVYL